ncbi:MAG: VOC family protein [Alphaproteobacteria bacterium]|jgi:catechol 2,3-dioxygenase-like lactoylglutathione lyase family enzyme|nr:VOC family protein [Alphaproteobacteria bacterium]
MVYHINSLVPEFWCSDFDESLLFYTEVLGFSVGQRRGDDHHAYIERGDAQLMIARWEQDEAWEPGSLEKPYGRGVNFQILVEDVRALYEAVLAAGVEPFVTLETKSYWRTDRMDVRTQFAILDPDGYLLRFSQVDASSEIEQSDLDELDIKYA